MKYLKTNNINYNNNSKKIVLYYCNLCLKVGNLCSIYYVPILLVVCKLFLSVNKDTPAKY